MAEENRNAILLRMVNASDPPWSERQIRDRVRRELDRRGMHLSDLPPSYAENKKWGPRGPTLATLIEGAAALRWTIGQLLGIEPVGDAAIAAPPVDERIIRQATIIALGVLPPEAGCPAESHAIIARLITEACAAIALVAQDSPDLAFSNGALAVVSAQLKLLWARLVAEKS